MLLLTTLSDDIKVAAKARDKETLAVLRVLKTTIQNDQTKAGCELNGEEKLIVLSCEMRQRKGSLSEFEKAGRDDLVERVKIEMVIVEKYMPQQLTEEGIRQLIQEVTAQTGATLPKDFGRVMSAMIPKVKGKADGNQVNTIVKELLQEN